jgi:hypothetical protein
MECFSVPTGRYKKGIEPLTSNFNDLFKLKIVKYKYSSVFYEKRLSSSKKQKKVKYPKTFSMLKYLTLNVRYENGRQTLQHASASSHRNCVKYILT